MTCEFVTLPSGHRAIVCGPRQRSRKCACGGRATLLCDWKIGDGRTCDADICSNCTTKPAPDKDLCPDHAKAFEQWKEKHRD